MPSCQRRSRSARAHRIEVTIPAGSPHRPGLLEAEGFASYVAQGKVDRLALRSEVITLHHALTETGP